MTSEIFHVNWELWAKRNKLCASYFLADWQKASRPSSPAPASAEELEQEKEAITSVTLASIEILYLFGWGSAQYYRDLFSWLNQNEERALVLIDNDIGAIYRFLSSPAAQPMLTDPQVWLYYFNGQQQLNTICSIISGLFCLKAHATIALPNLSAQAQANFKTFCAYLSFALYNQHHSFSEYMRYGGNFFSNLCTNFTTLTRAHLSPQLFGHFKNVPAIICGAGPSLEKNGAQLATLNNRALLFAGGSALNALDAFGLTPHFAVGVDPNRAQLSRLFSSHCWMVPFFFRPRLNCSALEAMHGEIIYLCGSGGHLLTGWLEKELGMESSIPLSEGYNVVNLSVSLAHALGCNPLILVGVDMAYSEEKSYAAGVQPHPRFANKEFYTTKRSHEELLTQDDIYGQPVHTLSKWVSESSWLSQFAKGHPEILLLNATEGGIGCQDVENLSLFQASQRFLQHTEELEGRIHSALQLCAPGSLYSWEELQALLQRSYTQAEQLSTLCQEIITGCEKSIQKLPIATENQDLSHIYDDFPMAELEQTLCQEPLFSPFLWEFDNAFLAIHQRELLLYSNNAFHFPKLILAYRRLRLQKKRYDFLLASTNALMKALTGALNHYLPMTDTPPAARPVATAATVSAEHDGLYQIDQEKELLLINDPELALQISVPFQPEPKQGVREELCQHIIKECFYQNGLLHGPVSYFDSKSGALLSRCWFVNGQKTGQTRRYYHGGALYCILPFKQGLPWGTQRYYYPNGALKALLPYDQGRLEGVVELFFENSSPQRSIAFRRGLRHGCERLWHRNCILAFEGHFEAGQSSTAPRQWNERGEPIASGELSPQQRAMGPQSDFFCYIAQRGLLLSKGLEAIGQQLLKYAALLPAGAAHRESCQALLLQVEKLKQHSQRLAEAVDLYGTSPHEMIWKTPALRLEVEKQLTSVLKELTTQFNELEKATKALKCS